jgi:hypothetical protein
VQLMRVIYQTAVNFISWLGPEGDRSTAAFLILRRIAQETAHLAQDGNRFKWLWQYPNFITDTREGQNIQLDDIHRLWKRDY